MTGSLFSDYFKNKLHAELKTYCDKEDLPFKILLLVDNAPSHPPSLQNLSSNIKLAFLPPNTTSLLQPCDQGIIQTFKSYYLRSTMATAVKITNEKNISLREYWKTFTIKDAISFVKKSWEEVPTKCLNGVWKKLCPQFVHSFEGFTVDDVIQKTNKQTLGYAKDLGLEEVEHDDIEQLLQSHRQELTNEELIEMEAEKQREQELAAAAAAEGKATSEQDRVLTKKILHTALAKIEDALDDLKLNDPNIDRSSSVARNVMGCVFCYTEMLKDLEKQQIQPTLLSYFKIAQQPEKVGELEVKSAEGEKVKKSGNVSGEKVEKSGKVKGSNFDDSEVDEPDEVDDSEVMEEED